MRQGEACDICCDGSSASAPAAFYWGAPMMPPLRSGRFESAAVVLSFGSDNVSQTKEKQK
jgi:hypothetical protein